MANLSLYYLTQLEGKVSLLPNQIDGNIDNHLLENLRAKIEGKTIEHGIVLKINRLIDYEYGLIDKANFMGTTVYQVKYECFICSPTKDLEIICRVANNIKGFLVAQNGPVLIAIQFNNIDTQKFTIKDDNIVHIKTNKPIEKGDYLKVSIINIKNTLGSKNILTMAKLLNLASKEEIQSFQQDQQLATGASETDTKIFI